MLKLIIFAFINMLAAMSPGPDFAIVTKYGLTGHRKAAFSASFGIATALLIHVFYCVVGIAIFIQSSPRLFYLLQMAGASYLGYLGFKMATEHRKKISSEGAITLSKKAFLSGFLTNLLNPKAALFLLSLFSEFLTPGMSIGLKVLYGVIVPSIALCWFLFLSYLLTHPTIYAKTRGFQKHFTFIMGLFLLALSLFVIGTAIDSLYHM